MRIGILGSGDVGQALGLGFARYGHQVMMGSRDAGQEKVRKWVGQAGENASAGSFAEAAAFGDLAVLATLWSGTGQAIALAGPERLVGKPVIDVTNPLDFSRGTARLALGYDDSGGEQVQRWLSDSRVVKAFNTVGHAHMVDPVFPGGPPDMFICGNDPDAKRIVTGLLEDFGWSVVDLGGIACARYLEPMAMVWILHYVNTGTGNHAFKLLRS